jgi:hypothetical protein
MQPKLTDLTADERHWLGLLAQFPGMEIGNKSCEIPQDAFDALRNLQLAGTDWGGGIYLTPWGILLADLYLNRGAAHG